MANINLTRVRMDLVLNDEEIKFLKWYAKKFGYGDDWRDCLRLKAYAHLLNEMDLFTYEMTHEEENK